ncbi:S41 family peptidase [Clostridium cellulovorans]|uniref:Carboxyl-terminal protease n=1 Tax=Clostridium cellulovorans (strain ATCC 35296 / DSM 3052 / OCM 3 / 743B) TaxID=573061 RepID=D9SUX4_CLOC7|nr:S41 family peptidase [Clostridium cellulovorans]ADL51029.1 carboxyl-terminal protease [Clostridium cellulovorans 743B]
MKNRKIKSLVIASLIITNMCTFLIAIYIPIKLPNGTVTLNGKDYKNYIDFQQLIKIKNIIDTRYAGDMDEEKMVEASIKAMTSALKDPYTTYMNKEEYKKFKEQTEGVYTGIGVTIAANEKDEIKILSVMEDSPAEKAGIKSEDILKEVNGITVTYTEKSQAIEILQKQNEDISVKIIRNGNEELNLTLRASRLERTVVTKEMLEDDIGYITLKEFDTNCSQTFKTYIKELSDQGMRGLIIDLRDNPGGLLSEVLKISDNFVEKGDIITYTVDKYDDKKEYKAEDSDVFNMPLVLLVNGGSASASEVFTGVIKDYGKGIIVGTTTFGKGIVQSIYETEGDTAIKITTSKYYTPNGINIHKIGIKPDVEVEYPKELMAKEYNRNEDPQFIKGLEILKTKIK